MAPEPSPRRFALWAVCLVAPLVLGVLVLPHVRRWAGATGEARSAAVAASAAGTETARRADAALGLSAGAPGASGQAAPPPPRWGPTVEEIEARRAAEEELARARRGWQQSQTLAPREGTIGPDGERVAPFQGFGLSIDSTPPGARVLVGGQMVGETPILTSVDCVAGDPVEVRLERKPYQPQVRTVRCRADALLSLAVTLRR